jgi:hypothetical protein
METIKDYIDAEVAKPPPDNLDPDDAREFYAVINTIIELLKSGSICLWNMIIAGQVS